MSDSEYIDKLEKQLEELQDERSDWGYELIKQFDPRAAESTDAYTYVSCLNAKVKRLKHQIDELITQRDEKLRENARLQEALEKSVRERGGGNDGH